MENEIKAPARATAQEPRYGYRYNARAALRAPNATTVVPQDLAQPMGATTPVIAVALGGAPVKKQVRATAGAPPETVEIAPATPAQLEYLYVVEKHPAIERYQIA